jgi:tetratricopeptide (TPR) repeat protein
MGSGLSEVRTLIRAGRFVQAKAVLSSRVPRIEQQSPLGALISAELLIYLGDLHEGSAKAAPIVDGGHSPEFRAWAYWLVGQVEYYFGRNANAEGNFKEAKRLSGGLRSDCPNLYASVLLGILRLALRASSVEHLQLQINEARRATLQAGDSHLLAELRLIVAELESRKGGFAEAFRHLAQAENLLNDEPNLFLEGVLWNHRCVVYALTGDTVSARACARRALGCADESGHFRVRIGAQINITHLDLSEGVNSGLENRLKTLVNAVSGHVPLRMAALDVLANLYLSVGNIADARRCAARILRDRRANSGQHNVWEHLTETYTRANIALSDASTDAG